MEIELNVAVKESSSEERKEECPWNGGGSGWVHITALGSRSANEGQEPLDLLSKRRASRYFIHCIRGYFCESWHWPWWFDRGWCNTSSRML